MIDGEKIEGEKEKHRGDVHNKDDLGNGGQGEEAGEDRKRNADLEKAESQAVEDVKSGVSTVMRTLHNGNSSGFLALHDVAAVAAWFSGLFSFLGLVVLFFIPTYEESVIDFRRGVITVRKVNVIRIRSVSRYALSEFRKASRLQQKKGRKLTFAISFSFKQPLKTPRRDYFFLGRGSFATFLIFASKMTGDCASML